MALYHQYMGALGSRLDQSDSLVDAALNTRREISILEEFRNAARGASLSAGPVIAFARTLVTSGQQRRGLELLETAAGYRETFDNEDYGVLCLAATRMIIDCGDLSRAPFDSLTALVHDQDASDSLRTQAALCLAELSASAGQYAAAALILTPSKTGGSDAICRSGAIVLARAIYLNLAGDSAAALEETRVYQSGQSDTDVQRKRDGLIQYAWSLTHSGRFRDSNDVLSMPLLADQAHSDVLHYIQAWNKVGLSGVSFGEAMKELPALRDGGSHESEWMNTFFSAWRAFAAGHVKDSLGLFRSLSADNRVEPTLNGTREELATRGRAHAAFACGDYDDAYRLFQSLSTALPARPAATRLQVLMDSFCYGLVAAKLHPVAVVDELSAARRCAQITLSRTSPVIPRFMDLEAELLLASGRSAESRATRVVALELVDEGSDSTDRDRLSHKLGLYLVDAYESQNDSASQGLHAILPALYAAFGPHHEKTTSARYALASLLEPAKSTQEQFEALHEDLLRANGPTDLLTLKSLYGVALTLRRRGDTRRALEVFQTIVPLLTDLQQNRSFGVSVQRRIGESHRALHQYDAACKAFESALRVLATSVCPSAQRKLQIELDLNECRIKSGTYRVPMHFFNDLASSLRATGAEETSEYFRAVEGYASCLEHLGNHKGSAHNYGHLVRLFNQGIHAEDYKTRLRIHAAAAWNNEQSSNYAEAVNNYETALRIIPESNAEQESSRLAADLEHRLTCCKARLIF